MQNLSIIDDTFDPTITSTYHLSLQFSPRNFCFAIMDTIRMRYIAFKNFWFETELAPEQQAERLRGLLQNEGYLAKNYKSVNFMIDSPGSLLIPAPLFQPDEAETYYLHAGGVDSQSMILNHKIPAIDAFLLFQVRMDIHELIKGYLSEFKIFHQAVPQIEDAVVESKNKAIPAALYAEVHSGFTDLYLVNAGSLMFYNSFTIRNDQDLTYYILYLYDQFGLPQEETPLFLSGFIELYPAANETLMKFIKKFGRLEFNKSYSYGSAFNTLIQHQFANLINLARCE